MFKYLIRVLFRRTHMYERFNLFDHIYKTEVHLVGKNVIHQHYYIAVDGTKTPVCLLCKNEVPPATKFEGLFCPSCHERVNHEWKKTFKCGIKN